MNYELLKIEGNVAYLFDKTRGVVVVAPVQGMGAPTYTPPPPSYIPQYIGDPVPPYQVISNAITTTEPPQTVDPRLPTKPTSIIPKGMRGLFVEPGQHGADQETRRV
jgi:hypothetical protein